MAPTGITLLSQSPASIKTTFPVAWPMIPDGKSALVTEGLVDYSGTRQVEIMVAVQPIAQNRQAQNYDATIAAMDNLDAALKTLDATLPAYGLRWEMRGGVVTVAGVDHWGFVCVVIGSDV